MIISLSVCLSSTFLPRPPSLSPSLSSLFSWRAHDYLKYSTRHMFKPHHPIFPRITGRRKALFFSEHGEHLCSYLSFRVAVKTSESFWFLGERENVGGRKLSCNKNRQTKRSRFQIDSEVAGVVEKRMVGFFIMSWLGSDASVTRNATAAFGVC